MLRVSGRVVVFFSSSWATRTSYVQREPRRALELAEDQPEGAIYVIPVRLDNCEVPDSVSHLQSEAAPRAGACGCTETPRSERSVWPRSTYERYIRVTLVSLRTNTRNESA